MSFHGPQPPLPQQGHTQPTNRNESFNVAPGGFVESFQPHGFSQIQGIWVDNFSGGWLSIEHRNLWVPPYTRGWKASVLPSMASITIRSYDFANGVVITGATGQAAVVTVWEQPNGDSEGFDFFDQQTVPINIAIGGQYAQFGFGFQLLIAAPTVGRIRIYEVKMCYQGQVASTNQGVFAQLSTTAPAVIKGALAISPASPMDTAIFNAPGGDLPIGRGLQALVAMFDTFDASFGPNLLISVRYAIR